jgi:hypothetical protein
MATFSRAALTMMVMGAGGAGLSFYPTAALPQILNKADVSRPILVQKLGRGHQFRAWGPTIIGGPIAANAFGPYGGPFIYGVPAYPYCGYYPGGYYGFGYGGYVVPCW